MVTDTGHFQADGVENNTVADAAYLAAWIDKQYNAEGEPAIPSFINGEAAIFYWGPVEPTEQ